MTWKVGKYDLIFLLQELLIRLPVCSIETGNSHPLENVSGERQEFWMSRQINYHQSVVCCLHSTSNLLHNTQFTYCMFCWLITLLSSKIAVLCIRFIAREINTISMQSAFFVISDTFAEQIAHTHVRKEKRIHIMFLLYFQRGYKFFQASCKRCSPKRNAKSGNFCANTRPR